MTHNEKPSAITPELEAKFEVVTQQAMSGWRNPEAMRRAAARMDRMREETYLFFAAPPRGFGRTTLASQRPPGFSWDTASVILRASASASGS